MDAVLGQEPIVDYLKAHLADPPHLLLWGSTGIGKTMLANAFIDAHHRSQGVTRPADMAAMTLRLSSADDRGISAIRQRLTEFVRRVRPVKDAVAWVLIDDADNLPVVTQQALRRILEIHVAQTRFCFVAQSAEKFIEPIQSRCVILQLLPVVLQIHGAALAAQHAPGVMIQPDALSLMAGICQGNARQFAIAAQGLSLLQKPEVTVSDVQLLINAPPVALLLRLQDAIIARDIHGVTDGVLALWSRGYSFEDLIAMLEQVVRIYNCSLTAEHQYVLQCCAEGHIFQILNRMTTLDLIAVLSGVASSDALAETICA